jgi:DNA polymerase-3 subunit delta'
MRPEAHNSLLKTLEEPPSRTIIILVTQNPYLLLGTIRSRCRMLQFGEIPQNRIEQYLVSTAGRTVEDSRFAAALSGGSLASALDFNAEEYRDIRRDAFEFVALMLRRGKFSEASAIAARVAKDKKFFELWIESAAALLQDVYYAGLATERVGQRDLLERMKSLSESVSRSRLVRAIDGIGKLKSELFYNVNRQLALEAMFLELDRHA